ncbi:MAG: fibronectin type III domain-containing protein [bacterium]|nr:fibronectin type III domain-containing protein [bacterium]
MRQPLFFLVLFSLFLTTGKAQDCDQIWRQFDQNTPSETGEDMAVDGAGNVYLSASGASGSSIRKYSPDGVQIWETVSNNPSEETANLSVADNGDLVASGFHWSFITGNPVGDSVWIARYNSAGTMLWRKSYSVYMFQIFSFSHLCTHRIGSNGDIYLAADTQGELVLYKFDASGNLLWSAFAGTGAVDYPTDMELTPGGNVLFAGSGPTDGHLYISQFDPSGNIMWEVNNTSDYNGVQAVMVAPGGNILALTTTHNGANNDITVAEYSTSGTFLGNRTYDTGVYEFPKDMAVDAAGNYYFLCQSTQTSGLPYVDWITVKGDNMGNVLWSDRYNETTNNDEIPASLHLGVDGLLYATGSGGPQYPHGPTGLMRMSNVTVRYNPANGNRACTVINQEESTSGLEVYALASGGFYLLGNGSRELFRYGNAAGVCPSPSGLTVGVVTSSTAQVSWAAAPGAMNYSLRYRRAFVNAIWAEVLVSGTSATLSNLQDGVTYEWELTAHCSTGASQPAQGPNFVTDCLDTDGDGICDFADQCPGLDDALIGTPCDDGDPCTINDVYTPDCNCVGDLIDQNNNNICDLDETADCTAPVSLQAEDITGTSAVLSWDPASAADQYLLQYLPQGAPFNQLVSETVSSTSHMVFGLSESTVYLWRVRAICANENSPFSDVQSFTTGTDTCPDTDADGICDADDQCPGFDDALIGTSCDDGDSCTENDVYGVDCNCAGTLIDSNNNNICDLDEGCTAPDNLQAVQVSGTSGMLSWNAVPNANSYRLQYRPIGGSPVSIAINTSSYTINNLLPGTVVQWRVKALCSNANSAFVVGPNLNIGGNAMASNQDSSQPIFVKDSEDKADFRLFPNPASNRVFLETNSREAADVTVLSLLGQELGRYRIIGGQKQSLNTADWGTSQQVVLIRVTQEGKKPVIRRLLLIK